MKDYADLKKGEDRGKGSKKLLFTAVKFAFGILIFAGFVFAIVFGYQEISNRYARLKYVVITGNSIIPTKVIKQYIANSGSGGLSSYSLSRIYFKILSNPWVKSAKIAKIFPDTLYIVITEKKPVAFVYYKKTVYLIDKNGSLISRYEKYVKLPKSLPKIVLKANLLKDKQLLKSIVNLYEKLDKIGKINYIDVVSESYQVAYFDGGLKVIVSSIDCPDIAIERFRKKWRYLNSVKDRLDSVSICFDNKFVLKWKKGVGR